MHAPVSTADDLATIVESKRSAWQCQEFADLLGVSAKFVYGHLHRGRDTCSGHAVNLGVSQIDLSNRTIDLNPGETKNRGGRNVKTTERVYQIIAVCVEDKAPDGFVFTRPDGSPPGDFRRAWANACERAGCSGLLFHDLRRTGARNMRRLGIAENVIMKIGGWKTASVFRRYDIVDQSDLADASRRIDDRQKELATEFGASLGKVGTQNGANESTAVQ